MTRVYYFFVLPFIFLACYYSDQILAQEINLSSSPYYNYLQESQFPDPLKHNLSQFKSGEWDKAILSTSRLISKQTVYKSLDKAHFLKALSLQALSQHEAALIEFSETLKYRGSNSDYYFFKTLSELALGKKEEALNTLNEAIWFGKSSIIPQEEIYLLIAKIHLENLNLVKAEEFLLLALAKNTDFNPARIELASLAQTKGDKVQALRILREALQKTPENFSLRLKLANILVEKAHRILNQRDILEAKGITQAIYSQNNLSLEERRTLIPVHVKVLLASGDILEAKRITTKALKKYPEDAEIKEVFSQLTLELQAQEPAQPLS